MDNNSNGFVAGILHFVLKIFLGLIALVFAACLLAVGLVAMVFSLLKALVTWKKPTPWVVFRQVQKYSARSRWPGPRDAHGRMTGTSDTFTPRDRQQSQSRDVVDVEVREVPQADIRR